jgi:hypothetical protein
MATAEIVVALACILASALGVLVVRRWVPLEKLVEHHEVAGVCFAVVGGLYGIILAFVLVSSWERYETARSQTEIEASATADLFRHAEAFSEPTRSRLKSAVLGYAQSVIDEEWPAMQDGHASQPTQERYYQVWNALTGARPTEGWEIALYQSSLDKLDDLADGRRNRIFYLESGVPSVIWTFLIAFGVATVSFTYFFGMPRLAPQIVITIVLAATVVWTLELVHETQTPFSGELRVDDRAFRVALAFMKHQAVRNDADQPRDGSG